jgi:hypothetical protein
MNFSWLCQCRRRLPTSESRHGTRSWSRHRRAAEHLVRDSYLLACSPSSEGWPPVPSWFDMETRKLGPSSGRHADTRSSYVEMTGNSRQAHGVGSTQGRLSVRAASVVSSSTARSGCRRGRVARASNPIVSHHEGVRTQDVVRVAPI